MVSDDLNVEPRLTKPGSICYLDEKKLCLFAIFTLTRDEFHELNHYEPSGPMSCHSLILIGKY